MQIVKRTIVIALISMIGMAAHAGKPILLEPEALNYMSENERGRYIADQMQQKLKLNRGQMRKLFDDIQLDLNLARIPTPDTDDEFAAAAEEVPGYFTCSVNAEYPHKTTYNSSIGVKAKSSGSCTLVGGPTAGLTWQLFEMVGSTARGYVIQQQTSRYGHNPVWSSSSTFGWMAGCPNPSTYSEYLHANALTLIAPVGWYFTATGTNMYTFWNDVSTNDVAC